MSNELHSSANGLWHFMKKLQERYRMPLRLILFSMTSEFKDTKIINSDDRSCIKRKM